MDPTDRLDAYELRLSKRGGSVDLSADETVLVD
jgi:calcium-dependent protein kinase